MCPAVIDGVECARTDDHTEHARGFLMWTDEGDWWSCRAYADDGTYIFPGDPRWNG